MNKILLMGAYSFVATNIENVLTNSHYSIHKFTRGIEDKKEKIIKGNVFSLSSNPYFRNRHICRPDSFRTASCWGPLPQRPEGC